jgi:hypothetical protein
VDVCLSVAVVLACEMIPCNGLGDMYHNSNIYVTPLGHNQANHNDLAGIGRGLSDVMDTIHTDL